MFLIKNLITNSKIFFTQKLVNITKIFYCGNYSIHTVLLTKKNNSDLERRQ